MTAPATHYRLSIEAVPHATPDGETVTTVDLVATDDATGRRFVYVGPVACDTQGEALDLMARIYAWERRGDRTLDPTARPEFWTADLQPTGGPVAARARRAKRVDAGKARRAAARACAAG